MIYNRLEGMVEGHVRGGKEGELIGGCKERGEEGEV